MKHLVIAAVPLFLAGLAYAQKPATAPANTPVTLEALLNPPSKANSGVTDLRAQMLADAGKTLGFRGGMAARAQILADALAARTNQLDTIFLFSPMINKNGTLPPVIVEARDVASFSPEQIRTATRVYKIEREERFVSVPPTWRDYLFVGLPVMGGVDLPTFQARPQDDKEVAIWKGAVTAGWKEGETQADAILAANFNRLTRDYSGMLMYSTLLQQGMVSITRVAESQQTVSSDGKVLILGDKLRRVTKKAAFESDASKWRPTVGRAKRSSPKTAAVAAAAESKPTARRKGDAGK